MLDLIKSLFCLESYDILNNVITFGNVCVLNHMQSYVCICIFNSPNFFIITKFQAILLLFKQFTTRRIISKPLPNINSTKIRRIIEYMEYLIYRFTIDKSLYFFQGLNGSVFKLKNDNMHLKYSFLRNMRVFGSNQWPRQANHNYDAYIRFVYF